jgi:hypothetical protein
MGNLIIHITWFLLAVSRRVFGSIIAIIMLMISAYLLFVWLTTNTSLGGGSPQLTLVSTHNVKPVSVENAQWQVALIVSNSGSGSGYVTRVFVNKEDVDVYGIVHGDTLTSDSVIATSVSESGLEIASNSFDTIHLWIGVDAVEGASQITVHLNNVNELNMMKTISLN